jgi:hypothetical protein
MECKREWNRDFIDTKLTQTFRKGALRQHRRKVLMDRERGRLPSMQVYVEAQMSIEAAQIAWNEARIRRATLRNLRGKTQADYGATDTLEQLTERLRPINKERSELRKRMEAAENTIRAAHLVLTGKEKEVRQFIMRCPAEECRGFLSSAWKCGTCQQFFCSDCHVQKTDQKDDNHKCNDDAKATAAMIKKETKPCPKCAIRISKIDGCDQMWCTSCQTTFSWESGQILLNTVTHNPHYYEYLRSVNNGTIPREAGDVPCGGLPNAYSFTRMILDIPILSSVQKTEILDIVRCLSDIQYVRLPQFPLRLAANVNQDIDIKYLMNKMTTEEWGSALERIESSGEKKKEIGLILQTLLHVGSEKLTQIYNSTKEGRGVLALNALTEMRKVRDYTNKSLVEKGNLMGMVVPQITKEWAWSWIKKHQMKNQETVEEENDIVAPSTTTTTTVAEEEDGDDDEMIFVDIGGEAIEMTKSQARAIFT